MWASWCGLQSYHEGRTLEMKIVDVRSTLVTVERQRPLKTSYGESSSVATVIVQLFTDEGITGIGQSISPAPFYGDTGEAMKIGIDKYLRPAVIGQDPFDIERLYGLMYRALRGSRYAITAVELALWDIKGKALNVPVYQLLGGRCCAGLPLHAFVERASAEETAARVRELSKFGWTWFKTKVGFGAREDVLWYQRLRELVPDNVVFQLDGNGGYTFSQAIYGLKQIERIGGVAVFEQPVQYLDEMAALARRLETPLQADELLSDPRSVYDIIKQRAAHALHFKLQKYGGLLQAKRMAAIAEAAGVKISVAPYFDIMAAAAAHLAVSTPNVGWPAGFSDMKDTLLTEALEPKGQILEPPQGPGLGVTVDEDKLAWYAKQGE